MQVLHLKNKENMESVFQCLILLMLVRFSASIFCYQCYRTDSNVICNENEPMKCGPQQPMCAVDTGVPRTVQKGCIEHCPLPGRGDMDEKTCWSCSDDFCNFGPGLPSPPGNLFVFLFFLFLSLYKLSLCTTPH
ncbi:uncharacterized protein LOC144747757 [Ciona intestinalis]